MANARAAGEGRLVYCGNLPDDVREREVEDMFGKYGRIILIDLKTPTRPPAYCFIEYDHPRDAEDAVRGRDGYDWYGTRLRVELARGRGPRGGGWPGADVRPRGTGYRVLVSGLPLSASWQDLKDFFRQIVTPSYTNVFRDRDGVVGVVEFESGDDMDRAIRKLDDTEFRNPFDKCYVRVSEDRENQGGHFRGQAPYDPSYYRRGPRGEGAGGGGDRGGYGRERSPPPRRSRSVSRSRSPAPRGGRSPSRSPIRARSVSRSPARGRSASPRRRSPSPRGRSASPRGRSASPRGRSASPRGRSASPRGRSASPRGRSASKSASPRRD